MKIDKSPEARQKETQIAELERQIRRTRATLKSLKTRLANTQSRIQSIQREAFSKIFPIQERAFQLAENLERLGKKLRKDSRLSKPDRAVIDSIYQETISGWKEQFPDMEKVAGERNAETEARVRDAFKEFRVEPPTEEQRDIRKLYLRLSKQFHPDRARGDKERKHHHQLQQQINEAYQTHDYQALDELDRLWEEPGEDAPATLDALDSKISRLQNQLQMLKQQQERLSEEIKNLRESELGRMLTQMDGLERAGITFENMAPVQEIEATMEMLEKLQAALEDTDRQGKLSPLIRDFLRAIESPGSRRERTCASPKKQRKAFTMSRTMSASSA